VVDHLGDPHVCVVDPVYLVVEKVHYMYGMFLDNVVYSYFGLVHRLHFLIV
jgi:hypothetical protein